MSGCCLTTRRSASSAAGRTWRRTCRKPACSPLSCSTSAPLPEAGSDTPMSCPLRETAQIPLLAFFCMRQAQIHLLGSRRLSGSNPYEETLCSRGRQTWGCMLPDYAIPCASREETFYGLAKKEIKAQGAVGSRRQAGEEITDGFGHPRQREKMVRVSLTPAAVRTVHATSAIFLHRIEYSGPCACFLS